MRPTLWLGAAMLLAGLLAATVGPEWGGLVALLSALGAGLDALRLPRRGDIRIVRELPPRVRQGREITVRLRLQSRVHRPLVLLLRDEPPPSGDAPPPMRLGLSSEGTAEAEYSVTITERGPQTFGRVFWLSFGPLRLLARHVVMHLQETVLVYPDLYGGRPRITSGQAGRGERLSKPGQSGQFESLREYAPGDPYRSVNWLASARRGSLMVNAFRAEAEQPILLLVDAGRTLFGQEPGGDRMAMAIRAAFALADEAVSYGDRIGLLVYDSERREEVAPLGGVQALHRIARAFALTDARPVESDHLSALSWAIETRARRSLVVWFTDLSDAALQEELLPFIRAMTRHHLVLQVAMPGRQARVATSAADAFSEASAILMRHEQRERSAQLAASGVMIVRGTGGVVLEEAVRRAYREIKERGQL